MEIFEFLRTTFKVAAAFITQDVLIYMSIAVVLFIFVWSLLSLIFNSEIRFISDCNTIISYVKKNNIDAENYTTFTKMWGRFPSVMKRGWRAYERKLCGIPSDYLKQDECVDMTFNGGILKHNRSLMKTFINGFFILTFLFSLANIGTVQGEAETSSVLTTGILAESLLVPLYTLLLMKLVYYIYTSIRHQEYKMCVETFHDLVDVLDERVDLVNIFAETGEMAIMLSDVYFNETMDRFREMDNRKLAQIAKRNKEFSQEEVVSNSSPKNLKTSYNGLLDEEKPDENKEVVSGILPEPKAPISIDKSTIGKTKSELAKPRLIVSSNKEFLKYMEEVEKLLALQDKKLSADKRKENDLKITELMSALNEYRNNSKKKKD